MKKQSEGIARHRMTVFTVLVLLAITAAACSSGGQSGSLSNSNILKPANAISLLNSAYAHTFSAPNIAEDISMDIKYTGLNTIQGNSAASVSREAKILSDIFTNGNITVSESRNSQGDKSSLGSENELISFNYKSTPLAEIFLVTTKPDVISDTYFRVSIANIADLPIHYKASNKNLMAELGTIIQPIWYKVPHPLLIAIGKIFEGLAKRSGRASAEQASAKQVRLELQNQKLALLPENLINSLFTPGFSVTSTTNQDGEDLHFSENYSPFSKLSLSLYKSIEATLSSKSKIFKPSGAPSKAKSVKSQDDTVNANVEIIPGNLLTNINFSTKIVSSSNPTQQMVASYNDTISYPNTAVQIPADAVNLSRQLVNYIVQQLVIAVYGNS